MTEQLTASQELPSIDELMDMDKTALSEEALRLNTKESLQDLYEMLDPDRAVDLEFVMPNPLKIKPGMDESLIKSIQNARNGDLELSEEEASAMELRSHIINLASVIQTQFERNEIEALRTQLKEKIDGFEASDDSETNVVVVEFGSRVDKIAA